MKIQYLLPALIAFQASASSIKPPPADSREAQVIDVAPVWSAHPVGFCLLTHAPYQFVAFYDKERRLTVARRDLKETRWDFTRLPVTTGWDSHNYVTMAVDAAGHLHLSGDMHCSPLVYFRTTKPLDPSSFERLDRMTGALENRTTYPRFFPGPDGRLIFTYRDGSSGNGNQIFNVQDPATRTWKRLLDTPLTDGEGKRNAYFDGPVKGPDGWFHLAWVWRETPDASTNHDLSHARSRDLVNWETAAGKPLKTPIRLDDGATVDPVPSGGGMINGNSRIGFDHLGRVTLSYHKHDANGNTQPWIARFEDGAWKLHQTTDWPARWEFGGGGTIGFGIHLGPVVAAKDGSLTQEWSHFKFGGGVWSLDPVTLHARETMDRGKKRHAAGKVEGSFPGLGVKIARESGTPDGSGHESFLRWETLGANRDLPREGPLPPPSMLRLHTVKR